MRGDLRRRDRGRRRSRRLAFAATTPIRSARATSARRAPRSPTSTTIRIGCAGRCAATATRWHRDRSGTRRSISSRRSCASIRDAHGKHAVAVYQGNPTRAQPRPHDVRPAAAPLARHEEPVLGDVARSAAAHARGAADVRQPAADAGARRRSRGSVHLPRRESARVERQHHDRARHARPAQGDPRSRRQGDRARSAAHRDRREGRSAPVHPARHRRGAAARDDPRAVRRAAGARSAALAGDGRRRAARRQRLRGRPSAPRRSPASPPTRSASSRARSRRPSAPCSTAASACACRSSAGSRRGCATRSTR